MSGLDDKIRQAIEEDLPRQTADALRKRLDESDDMEAKFERCEMENAGILDENSRLQEENDVLKKLSLDESVQNVRSSALNARERDLVHKEEIADLKVEMYKAMADQAKSFVAVVFANAKPVYTSTGYTERTIMQYDPASGMPIPYGCNETVRENVDITTREE